MAKKYKYKYSIALSILALFFIPRVFAERVDISSSIPSGTYHKPIRIELTATQKDSKTFYSFRPDGTPNDAYLYTGPILLKQSSPFIYFSIVSPENESKIKQNNYILDYPNTIRFKQEYFGLQASGSVLVDIVNSWEQSVDIGYWHVQSESENVEIPEGTILESESMYHVTLRYNGNGSIVLRSPDDDERDVAVKKGEVWVVVQPAVAKKSISRKVYSISDTQVSPEKNPSLSGKTDISLPVDNAVKRLPVDTSSGNANISSIPKSSFAIDTAIKVSSMESGQKNTNLVYLWILLLFSILEGIAQWLMGRKAR